MSSPDPVASPAKRARYSNDPTKDDDENFAAHAHELLPWLGEGPFSFKDITEKEHDLIETDTLYAPELGAALWKKVKHGREWTHKLHRSLEYLHFLNVEMVQVLEHKMDNISLEEYQQWKRDMEQQKNNNNNGDDDTAEDNASATNAN